MKISPYGNYLTVESIEELRENTVFGTDGTILIAGRRISKNGKNFPAHYKKGRFDNWVKCKESEYHFARGFAHFGINVEAF